MVLVVADFCASSLPSSPYMTLLTQANHACQKGDIDNAYYGGISQVVSSYEHECGANERNYGMKFSGVKMGKGNTILSRARNA